MLLFALALICVTKLISALSLCAFGFDLCHQVYLQSQLFVVAGRGVEAGAQKEKSMDVMDENSPIWRGNYYLRTLTDTKSCNSQATTSEILLPLSV